MKTTQSHSDNKKPLSKAQLRKKREQRMERMHESSTEIKGGLPMSDKSISFLKKSLRDSCRILKLVCLNDMLDID
jgi:hypothetical protein